MGCVLSSLNQCTTLNRNTPEILKLNDNLKAFNLECYFPNLTSRSKFSTLTGSGKRKQVLYVALAIDYTIHDYIFVSVCILCFKLLNLILTFFVVFIFVFPCKHFTQRHGMKLSCFHVFMFSWFSFSFLHLGLKVSFLLSHGNFYWQR